MASLCFFAPVMKKVTVIDTVDGGNPVSALQAFLHNAKFAFPCLTLTLFRGMALLVQDLMDTSIGSSVTG